MVHVLGFHCKILSGGGDQQASASGGIHWIRQTWASITQHPMGGVKGAISPPEREVPLLFRDPITILVQLILLLPSRLDHGMLLCSKN